MKRPNRYNTRQGKRIFDYMASLDGGHVTGSQIARHFENEEAVIGQTTIYRHLEKLVEGGKIRKYVLSGGSACYQYTRDEKKCREHFHLKCEQCGSLIHLDCTLLDKIQGHLLKDHKFQINTLKTVFYGSCEKCRSGG
jgi:Fur family ferric uptake transcriptional regulator